MMHHAKCLWGGMTQIWMVPTLTGIIELVGENMDKQTGHDESYKERGLQQDKYSEKGKCGSSHSPLWYPRSGEFLHDRSCLKYCSNSVVNGWLFYSHLVAIVGARESNFKSFLVTYLLAQTRRLGICKHRSLEIRKIGDHNKEST